MSSRSRAMQTPVQNAQHCGEWQTGDQGVLTEASLCFCVQGRRGEILGVTGGLRGQTPHNDLAKPWTVSTCSEQIAQR